MKRFTILFAALILCLSATAQKDSTYTMMIELGNGTKISLGTNDVKEVTFSNGQIVVSGNDLLQFMNTTTDQIKDLNDRVDKFKSDLGTLQDDVAAAQKLTDDVDGRERGLEEKIDLLASQLNALEKAVAELAAAGGGGSGNQDEGDGTITINGTDYRMSRLVTWEGSWQGGEGEFYLPVLKKVGNADDVLLYQFNFTNGRQPEVGDDFSTMSLHLTPADDSDYNVFLDGEIPYQSGTAKVVAIDKSSDSITIDFNKLTMGNGKASYVFNGKVWIDYNFAR